MNKKEDKLRCLLKGKTYYDILFLSELLHVAKGYPLYLCMTSLIRNEVENPSDDSLRVLNCFPYFDLGYKELNIKERNAILEKLRIPKRKAESKLYFLEPTEENEKIKRFLEKVKIEIETIEKRWNQKCHDCVDLTKEYTISIDGTDAKVFDDAFIVRTLKNGHIEVIVCIANFADQVTLVNNLRETSKYKFCVPRFSTAFISKNLYQQNYSLTEDRKRDVVAYQFEFDENHRWIKEKSEVYRAVIEVDENLTEERLLDELVNGNNITLLNNVNNLIKISHFLSLSNSKKLEYHNMKEMTRKMKRRLELKTPYEESDDPYSVSILRNTVSDFMILVGHYSAYLASSNKFPFLYRNNGFSHDVLEVGTFQEKYYKGDYDEDTFNELENFMSYSTYDITNKAHLGLGLNCYSRITSPLVDEISLLNQKSLLTFYVDRDSVKEGTKQEYMNVLLQARDYYNGLIEKRNSKETFQKNKISK